MGKSATPRAQSGWLLAAALVGFVAFLPFLRGALLGNSFFFRDLSRHYFPSRLFTIEGLRHGELRHWNPLVHEGEPAALPISYPLDLLQALWPSEGGLSFSLSLHVPFAAIAFLFMARQLGLGPLGGALGAIVYALGGFSLSSLSLYVHLQALAWAPLVVAGLVRASRGGSRDVAGSALLTAIALSTFGVEVTAQAVLFGIVLSAPHTDRRRLWRLASSLLLALGLSAPPLLLLHAAAAGGARAGGLPTQAVLGFSMHPMTLVQTLIAALYHDPSDPLNRYWGRNFSASFPYFLSVYLGAMAFCTAAIGAAARRLGKSVVLWALLAAWVCLGTWGRLDLLVELLPSALRAFRYPSKAFFSVHLAVALLGAAGLDALARDKRPWRWAGFLGLGLGGVLVALPGLAWLLPAATHRFVSAFFPSSIGWSSREALSRFILEDAAVGGLVCLASVLVAVFVVRGRLVPSRGAIAVCLLTAADLLRAGAGLNPMVTPRFYELSEEVSRLVLTLRLGRIFTCDPSLGRTLAEGHGQHQDRYEAWSQGVLLESLLPAFNVRPGLPSAYSRDLTMLVPERYVLSPREAGCTNFDEAADRLRRAGVAHVLSLDPIGHPALERLAVLRPARIAPLSLFVYELRGSLPLRIVASAVRPAADAASAEAIAREPGFLEAGGAAVEGIAAGVAGARGRVLHLSESSDELKLLAEADGPTVVVVRDAWAPGWRARVNGEPAPVLRSDGRHRAVEIGAGRSEVVLRYQPPALRTGLAILAVSLAVAVALLRQRRWAAG